MIRAHKAHVRMMRDVKADLGLEKEPVSRSVAASAASSGGVWAKPDGPGGLAVSPFSAASGSWATPLDGRAERSPSSTAASKRAWSSCICLRTFITWSMPAPEVEPSAAMLILSARWATAAKLGRRDEGIRG